MASMDKTLLSERFNVSLTPLLARALAKKAKKEGLKPVEAIRQAVREYVKIEVKQ